SVVLQIFDLSSYKLAWTVGTAPGVNQTFSNGTVGQEGPTYSPDGHFLWLPEQNGVTRFAVNADGTLGTPTTVRRERGRRNWVEAVSDGRDAAREMKEPDGWVVGWSFAVVLQGEAANHREVRRSRAGVLSLRKRRAFERVRCGSRRRAKANH
ncbi:MAG TPA: hypothetical protein VN803_02145, partial [Gemmatimonadales bacterium]|nr:hypothetical protein [Gemmatimonadales bacterium]